MITKVSFDNCPDPFSNRIAFFISGKCVCTFYARSPDDISTDYSDLTKRYSVNLYRDGSCVFLFVSKRVFDAVNLELSK
jgi:hypothetical protein